MTKILIIIALLIIAIIIIFLFDRKNISENFTNPILDTSTSTTPTTPTSTEPTTITTPTSTEPSTTTTPTSTTPITTPTSTEPSTTTPTTTTPTITTTPTSTTPTSTTPTSTTPILAAPDYNDIYNETTEWVRNNSIQTTTATVSPSNEQSTSINTQTPITGITNPQIMIPVGEQQSIPLNEVSIVDFLSVVLTYIPWGAYYAGNVSSDNLLLDLLNRTERNAVITGNITKNISNGNGASGNVSSIIGTTNTTIEFPNNSIPEKFTICSISRYTGTTNNKRILTAKNATPNNDWIHGHKSGQKGVVYYNEYKTNNSTDIKLSGELTDWVITCAKNDGSIPNNIYINGFPSGIRSGGNGNLKLSINKIDNANIINELSDFALSYVIIWDSCLSDKALKIISDSLVKYLRTGEQLLFDMSSLSIDDKFKVLNSKSTFLKGEVDETNAALLEIKKSNTTSITNAITTAISTATTTPPLTQTPLISTPSIVDDAARRIIAAAANAENKFGEQKIQETNPINNIINLNPTTAKISVNDICNKYTYMPDPFDASSFTEPKENISISSDNKAYQSYIWCKCNGDDGINNNTDSCKAYDICRDNYAKFKDSTYDNVPDVNKDIYRNCKIRFPNFPKYLEANSLK